MGSLGDARVSAPPLWLPAILSVEPWSDAVVEALYFVFDRDFRQSKPVLDGEEIYYFQTTRPDGKEEIFWHLITTEVDERRTARTPDFPRAARLPWVRCLIEHCTENEIRFWDYLEHTGDVKTYIWFVDNDFLIILKKLKGNRRRLLTSFCILYADFRGKLEKKYTKRL